MVVTDERAAPTVADARRAAACLCELLDPGMVLLYGSVARGEQTLDSDLDMVAVFDDLGDYSNRYELSRSAQKAVRDATGFCADVRVTDRAEWKIRTTRCRSTFEAHVAAHAVTIVAREPRAPVDMDKEIGRPSTDAAQAASVLVFVSGLLGQLLWDAQFRVSLRFVEDEFLASDLRDAERLGNSWLCRVCARAQAAMEYSVRGVIHALEGPHLPRSNVGDLIAAASSHAAVAGRLDGLLGDIAPEDTALWRETAEEPATYPDQAAKATVDFATAMVHAATRIATRCVELITLAVGEKPATALDVTEMCARSLGRSLPARFGKVLCE